MEDRKIPKHAVITIIQVVRESTCLSLLIIKPPVKVLIQTRSWIMILSVLIYIDDGFL